jgi:hypothetical protein
MLNEVIFDHPTEDPKLVSYVRPELRAMEGELQRSRDCYNLLRNADREDVSSQYLPQEMGEPPEAYEARLGRSVFVSTYRDAIRAYCGLLTNFQISEPPATLEQNLGNVDRNGSSVEKFLNDFDNLVFRDGAAAVLVDMPPPNIPDVPELAVDEDGVPITVAPELPASFREEIEQGRTPYLLLLERSNVINWRSRIIGGKEEIDWVVIRAIEEDASEDGDFGVELVPVYLHVQRGSWDKYRLERKSAGGSVAWEQVLIGSGVTTTDEVPIVWYSATSTRFGSGELPLAALADLSIQHFQLRSDLVELLHKVSMPVPVRKGAPLDANGNPPPLVIGPNTAVDLPADPGSGFDFAEPSGGSLQQHREEIAHVELLQDRASLQFLSSGVVKTATEAVLQGGQVTAQIKTMIENKESVFGKILAFWSKFTAEELANDSGLEIDDELIQRPLDAQEQKALLELFGQDAIDHKTLLEELKRGHALSQNLDIEAVMEAVKKQKEEAQQEAMDLMKAQADPAPETDAPGAGAASPDAPGKPPGPGGPAAAVGAPGAAAKPPAKAPAKPGTGAPRQRPGKKPLVKAKA